MSIFFGNRFHPFSCFKFKDLKPFWTKNLCLISEGIFCVSRDSSNTRYKRLLENIGIVLMMMLMIQNYLDILII